MVQINPVQDIIHHIIVVIREHYTIIQPILVLLCLTVNITKHIVVQLQLQAVMVVSVMVMLYPKQQNGIVTMLTMLTRPALGSFVVASVAMARMRGCSTSTATSSMLTATIRSASSSSLRALAL